jgi:hypothetical protein
MHARCDLGREHLGLADLVDAGDEIGVTGQEFEHAEAPLPAHNEVMVAVRRGDVAQNLGDGADAMQMLWAWAFDRRVALKQHADRLVGLGCSLRAGDRLRAAERERHHNAREQHGIARWQENDGALRQLELRHVA